MNDIKLLSGMLDAAGVTTVLDRWLVLQKRSGGGVLDDAELQGQSREFLAAMQSALDAGAPLDIEDDRWDDVRNLLADISRQRAQLGATPSQTALFVFSLKEPMFERLRALHGARPETVADALWVCTLLLDRLGLHTTELYQRTRDDIITRQQQELLELSTPVVELWDGILALPLIGTLDSQRTQVVMESLLEKIVETGAPLAIIDITGVPTVDTLVAQHLLKTVAAARLMGADCIISGIRPQIAQTIVHLGVDLSAVTTKSTLADAFAIALARSGQTIAKLGATPTRTDAERRRAGRG